MASHGRVLRTHGREASRVGHQMPPWGRPWGLVCDLCDSLKSHKSFLLRERGSNCLLSRFDGLQPAGRKRKRLRCRVVLDRDGKFGFCNYQKHLERAPSRLLPHEDLRVTTRPSISDDVTLDCQLSAILLQHSLPHNRYLFLEKGSMRATAHVLVLSIHTCTQQSRDGQDSRFREIGGWKQSLRSR